MTTNTANLIGYIFGLCAVMKECTIRSASNTLTVGHLNELQDYIQNGDEYVTQFEIDYFDTYSFNYNENLEILWKDFTATYDTILEQFSKMEWSKVVLTSGLLRHKFLNVYKEIF